MKTKKIGYIIGLLGGIFLLICSNIFINTSDKHFESFYHIKDVTSNFIKTTIKKAYDEGYRIVYYYEKHKDIIELCPEEKAFFEHIIYDGVDKKYIMMEIGAVDHE